MTNLSAKRSFEVGRGGLRQWLGLAAPKSILECAVVRTHDEGPFVRRSITYATEDGDSVPAFLLVPKTLQGAAPAVVVHHQHHGERHLGKSEVCGLIGEPLQAFGPALAREGIVVLAPDSICFEDRRQQTAGTEPHPDDWLQHYNEMSYRLLRGDTLMRKVLADAEAAVSVLAGLDMVDSSRIGLLGHSYGGNTTIFQAALDERVSYTCASGAVCSFREKMRRGTGIEMAEVLPGAIGRFDIDDLLRMVAPRRLLVVSAEEDPYSRDADAMVERARAAFVEAGAPAALDHHRHPGGHAMTPERFDRIIAWLERAAAR